MTDLIISSLTDGNMQLKGGIAATHNRLAFLKKSKIDPSFVISAGLINSPHVTVVDMKDAGKTIPMTDGLITTNSDVYLSITVADCLPIVIYSPGQVVALLHGGWRGLATGIIEHALGILTQDLGFTTTSLFAYIGPGIEAHHYPVGNEVASQFSQYTEALESIHQETYLNLKLVAQLQLMKLGISPRNIATSPVCTYCDQTHFSARRDLHNPVHAMMAIVSQKFAQKQ